MKEYPCHRIEFPSSVRIPNTMLCPECRRHMHRYNSFLCCHEDYTAAAKISPAVAAAATAAA
ncbi:hypothetical protein SOVF_206740 [Spinacia oleracea]|nr:hypothetical protein SOVF_206740 [Spinacia oleracea]